MVRAVIADAPAVLASMHVDCSGWHPSIAAWPVYCCLHHHASCACALRVRRRSLSCHIRPRTGLLAAAAKAARDAGVGGDVPDPASAMGMDGVDPAVMNRQAQQIWSMLDDMASNDPKVCHHRSVLVFSVA